MPSSPRDTSIQARSEQSPSKSMDFSTFHIVKPISKSKHEVFLTYAPKYQQHYAMKVFQYCNKQIHKNYVNESRFSWVSHPNIISMLEVQPKRVDYTKGCYNEVSYIIMELAPYGDFSDFVLSERWISDEVLIRTYFHHLLNGLEYLHTNEVSHLDLKLENLLLGDEYQLKIVDFDNSHVRGDKLINGGGTPNFRAPEIKALKCSNPKSSDIFSIGVILFALKTGVLPFFEDTLIEGYDLFTMMIDGCQDFWEAHRQLSSADIEFGDDFKDLIFGMTKRDPKQRISISDIKNNRWYQGPTYSRMELISVMSSNTPQRFSSK
jgi:5'-AMP-activated protein kinase catalytic alpha subunit